MGKLTGRPTGRPEKNPIKIGYIFGRLTIIDGPFYIKKEKGKGVFTKHYTCKCLCGNILSVRSEYIKCGDTKSCGCLNIETRTKNNFKHGMCETVEYLTWLGMHRRCYDKNDTYYRDYGGRGIKICDRWYRDNPDGFKNFYEDMGPRPGDKYSIDRYPNNDGNYTPENCRWATSVEQSKNRRNTVLLTYKGETLCQSDWAKKLGIKSVYINVYIKKGKDLEWIVDNYKKSKYCSNDKRQINPIIKEQ